MPNKLTNYLQSVSKTPDVPVRNNQALNFIRSIASEGYRADIPELPTMSAINHNSVPYATYTVHQNEFFNILVNRIGPVIVKALLWDNPLGVFRTENFTYGETLEEIYVDLADTEAFDAKDTASPFTYADTNILTFYHDITDERKYRRTIEKAWTMKAFTSDNAFDEFIDKLFMSLISSDELDEYEAIKNLIPQALTEVTVTGGGTIVTPATQVDTTLSDWILELNKLFIARSNLMATPSRTRFENAALVPNATPKDRQYLLVTAELSAELDSYYASAFNLNKATPLTRKIVVDEFATFTGSGTYNGATPIAALVSDRTIILKNKLLEMTNIYNPNTLSYNYFLHHHELISYSLLENAHIYYTM